MSGHFNSQPTVFLAFVYRNRIVTDGMFRTILNHECLDILQVIQIQQDISLTGCIGQQRTAVMAEERRSKLSNLLPNVCYILMILAAL